MAYALHSSSMRQTLRWRLFLVLCLLGVAGGL